MYCPKCLNNSLRLEAKGVVNIIINGKQMDAGRFLFDMGPGGEEKTIEDFKKKVDEFFKWYSNFQNKEPINYVELLSNHFKCEEGCFLSANDRFSILDIILPIDLVKTTLTEAGKKYGMDVQLKL